jgi:hypothetical protein
MPDPIVSRAELRPVTDLPPAATPLLVETEDVDGTPGKSLYGGAGASSEWDDYGFPTWRSDFRAAGSLADWTAIVGNKESAQFRSGVMFSDEALWLERSVVNQPFIFDVRVTLGLPALAIPLEVYFGVRGTLAPDRRLGAGLRQQSVSPNPASLYDSMLLSVRRFAGVTLNSEPTTFNNDPSGLRYAITQGLTMRCWYDGTSYFFATCWGDPVGFDSPNATFTQAKSSWAGDPAAVWFSLSAGAGRCARVAFAQYQTTNLDPAAGQ